MCRDKEDAGKDAATTLDKEKDGDKAKQKKKEWQCTHCAGVNPDDNVMTCFVDKASNCQGRSPKSQWQGNGPAVKASPLSKKSQTLLEEGDPVKLQE